MVAGVELNYTTGASALQMAQTIFGNGATVLGASYSGSSYSSAIYSGGSVAPGVLPGDSGVILSTGRANHFTNSSSQSNLYTNRSTDTGGQNDNSWFNAIAGTRTYDASYLDVTFVPDGNVLTMQFVFASEEYPEFSNSIYNDVVGVWINGTHVPLSVTNSAAQVAEINQTDNINLFQSNTGDQFNTEMDGFTITLTLTIPVNAGQANTIRFGIADTSDSQYDSNLLIAADSVQTRLVAIENDVTIRQGATKIVDVLANDLNATGGTLYITHINGVAVTPGQSVTLQTGQVVTLNADGTLSITTDSDIDNISFTYEVASEDASGNVVETDVGFITVETVPCFVAGTMILTPDGEVPVERLRIGDLVLTRDDGPQPLRWIGSRTVPATGTLAPVCIRAGTFGAHRRLMVSPQHRILVRDALAELLFAETEVLVAAKDLVNDRSIRRVEGGEVTYVHLLFDRHQVIWSEGLATESFLPGPQTVDAFEAAVLDELRALFPELDPRTGRGYSAAARRTLRHYEARALLNRAA